MLKDYKGIDDGTKDVVEWMCVIIHLKSLDNCCRGVVIVSFEPPWFWMHCEAVPQNKLCENLILSKQHTALGIETKLLYLLRHVLYFLKNKCKKTILIKTIGNWETCNFLNQHGKFLSLPKHNFYNNLLVTERKTVIMKKTNIK